MEYIPFDQRVLDTVKASLLAIKQILAAPIVSNEITIALQELAGVAERFASRLKFTFPKVSFRSLVLSPPSFWL